MFTLTIASGCFALMLFVLEKGEQRAIFEQKDKTRLLAHALENTVIRSVEDVVGRLRVMGETLRISPSLIQQDASRLGVLMRDLLPLAPGLRELAVHLPDGRWVASSRMKAPDDIHLSASCGQQLLNNGLSAFLVSEPQGGRYLGDLADGSGQYHIPLCLEVLSLEGESLAIVTAAMNPAYIKELFRPAVESNPVELSLYRYDGAPLVSAKSGDEGSKYNAYLDELFATRLSRQEFDTYERVVVADSPDQSDAQFVTSYRSTSPLPLVLIADLDLRQGLETWRAESNIIFWIFLALILAVVTGGSVLMIALMRKHRMEAEITLLTAAISSAANAIFITDASGHIQWINNAFEKLTGWTIEEVRNRTPRILNSGEHEWRFFKELWQTILQGEVWRGEITNISRHNKAMIVEQTITPIVNDSGVVTHFVAVHEDVTARTQAERKASFLSQHDSLTGLPNRRAFSHHVNDILHQSVKRRVALLLVDLDHFKTVNDTLGHQAGDEVLQTATRRINNLLADNMMLARLGGDEFAILIDSCGAESAMVELVEKILSSLAQPVALGESSFRLSASIGIAFGEVGEADSNTLLRQSDLAMYRAKHIGRSTYSVFDDDMDYLIHRHVDLEQGMRQSLVMGQGFSLVYQPIMSAKSLKPVKVEVLMRWSNQNGEPVSPGEFIPVAEGVGLITDIGHWQMKELSRQLSEWRYGPMAELQVALNISTVQLSRDAVSQLLLDAMAGAGIPFSQLVVEVTETALVTNNEKMLENLRLLRDAGVRLSIDDFGTGYSSLSYIRELDASILKIDKSFVAGIGENSSDEEIILATIALAKNLDIEIVAEGVETEQQAVYLRRAGVDYLQGYLYSKPLQPLLLEAYIEDYRPADSVPLVAVNTD
ncbi:bifunctional diguanylate cyclase/phosphodiesterase [Marinobacterium jannaschii]|uniref:bifunctional diguanylate cyclase/phosphodiesterase n=1 Tax=Marinobacterium jannaschii TaxID=64970 RepID=UPI000485CC5A|nr:EAL domain-containing protein [Marinobacterium jannaschii]